MTRPIHTTTTQGGYSGIWSLLNDAMERIPTEGERWNVRSDADVHRAALLDAIEFIGMAIEASTLTPSNPRQYAPHEIAKLGGFLMCAPELIRSMDALIEGYEEIQDMTRKGVNHG